MTTEQTILSNVISAMQDAEEIWFDGDYVNLMNSIIAECNNRIEAYKQSQNKE